MEEHEFKHGLGFTAIDVITGFTGVMVARTEYIDREDSYLLQPKAKLYAGIEELQAFAQDRLKILDVPRVTLPPLPSLEEPKVGT